MMPLVQRRRREIEMKLASLEGELADWAARTTTEPMRRHYSQVRRLTRTLNALTKTMTTSEGWTSPTDDRVLEHAATWEKRILTAHAIWEVFRSKLAQRGDPQFQERLLAYDDLAWACYEPAMKRFSAAPKEPPLVFLNSTWSAFLQRRGVSFADEVMQGKDAGASVNRDDYAAALRALPIPLLGLPWFQISHPPSALLIAHEAGHAVEFDFDLTETIREALRGAQLEHESDWLGAAREAFADVYGCLCLGRYFAGSLLDLIVADKATVSADAWFGPYPTRFYRVALATSTLRFLGLDKDADAVAQVWTAVYGTSNAPPGYEADAAKVVAAICGPQGLDLSTVIRPPQADIAALAQYAAQGNKTEVTKHTDARVLFCALRHVYENGTPSRLKKATSLLLAQVVQGYASVFRFRGGPVGTSQEIDQRLDALATADAEAAAQLEAILGLRV